MHLFLRLLLIGCLFTLPLVPAGAVDNYDKKTIQAMTEVYNIQLLNEDLNDQHLQKILKHYTNAEVATAGIFASKWLDRKAMTNVGPFGSSTENYYYKRIRRLVKDYIAPKLFSVACLMIKHPDKALYWGPFLLKTTEDIRSLLMTFEVVVCNTKLTFRDLAAQGYIYAIPDDVKAIFNLAKLGNVDWAALWDKLTDFGKGITKEDLVEDLGNLQILGQSIASAGGGVLADTWESGSRITKVFSSKPSELLKLYDDFSNMYETFSDVMNIKELVMSKLLSTDSTGVSRLLTPAGYNITSYLSDYLNEMEGRYYTQRWYIYRENGGESVVCDYHPPMDETSISRGDEWLRESTSDDHYIPTDAVVELSLTKSEYYAGYSRSWCAQQNRQSSATGKTYDFESTMHSVKLVGKGGSGNGKTQAWAFAHDIKVTEMTHSEAVVYEETFDSQYDDESVIEAKFDALLKGYNDKDLANVFVYKIGKDEKVYYSCTDATRMKGCFAASFTVTCDEHTGLGEGNFSWKENHDQRHALDSMSCVYAFETSLTGFVDTTALNPYIYRYEDMIAYNQAMIDSLYDLKRVTHSAVYDVLIDKYTYARDTCRTTLKKLYDVRDQLIEDGKEEDEFIRIPSVMHDIENNFVIDWLDDGYWDCSNKDEFLFIRRGQVPKLNTVMTFVAKLTRKRPESHFWGIRYHRAILQVSWSLGADYTTTEVVDVMELDNSLSDEAKAKRIDDRRREIASQYPSCTVEVDYAYSDPQQAEDDDDALHLLWIGDRLAVARHVDERLSRIYAELVMLEKYLYSRETLKDYLLRAVGLTSVTNVRGYRITTQARNRWLAAAEGAMPGTNLLDYISTIRKNKKLQAIY